MTKSTAGRANRVRWIGVVAGATLAAAAVLSGAAPAAEPVDHEMVNRIRDEGFHRSQVMATARHLTDVIGPRLSGSPGLAAAQRWTRDRLREWGLERAELEPWGELGRGWSFSRVSVHALTPRPRPLVALPKAWTPGTLGPVRGAAMRVEIDSEEDFEGYRGELAGKVLFIADRRPVEDPEAAAFERHDDDDLDELGRFEVHVDHESSWRQTRLERNALRKALNDFLVEERALAVVDVSSRDGGVVRLGGAGSRRVGESVGVPTLAMAAEHYNWVLRLLDEEIPVELEIEVAADFHDDDLTGYNTVAEIPGGDLAHEVVMLGAHLDSWHPADGANDNAAGCAVMMEAVRILKTLGVRPRRTVRIALWSGEEQGLLGSAGYVRRHFATWPEPEDEAEKALSPLLWRTWPITPKPEHATLSAYFNLDNGSGRIRGIYTQENAAVKPIFEAWLEPLHDLGADRVTNNNTGGTDHRAFDLVGLPGFQFVQDPLDYATKTHHTNLDTFDHTREHDLVQASVVVASFVYHAAMRDELLPRKPMPQRPKDEDEAAEGDDSDEED